ncbi:MAG TPA: hypothetical protein ENJ54_04090 [Chloroflexi bacterium]|nr:hypothetical protein [Chloroflexota bacterium]
MKMKSPVATAVAMAVGLIVLFGYFFPLPVFTGLRTLLLQWALILAGTALFVGMVNLSQYHWANIRNRRKPLGSVVVMISLWLTFALALYASPASTPIQWLFNAIIVPTSVALLGLLAFTLAYAAVRLPRRRPGLMAVLFLGTAVLIMLGAVALPGVGMLPFIGDTLRPWLAQVPAAAGARGILLGVALGTVATGLRILLGSDRPYGE